MKKFEYFDVTADIGFYAFGKNLNEAFENAGLAMFNIISDTDNIDSDKAIEFEITSEDRVSLLYDYLEELLFYHEVEFMLFSEFDIKIEEIDNNYNLNAVIKGETSIGISMSGIVKSRQSHSIRWKLMSVKSWS